MIVAAVIHLSPHGYYIHWGVVQISLANAIVILAMIAVFVVALLVPFHGGKDK